MIWRNAAAIAMVAVVIGVTAHVFGHDGYERGYWAGIERANSNWADEDRAFNYSGPSVLISNFNYNGGKAVDAGFDYYCNGQKQHLVCKEMSLGVFTTGAK